MPYEIHLVEACKEMTSQLNRAEAFEEYEEDGLLHAAVIGCNALRDLIANPSFRQSIDELYTLRRENRAEVRKILEDLALFNEFLSIERRILLEGGFPEYLADQIIGWSQDIRLDVLERDRTPNEVIANVEVLRDQSCGLSDELKRRRQEEAEKARAKRLLSRIKKGMAGSALVALNAAAGITIGVTTALPTAGGGVLLGAGVFAVSGAIGSGIIGNATSEGTADSSRGASASA